MWKTYAWMSAGLGLTGLVAMVLAALSIESGSYGELSLTPIGELVFSPIVYWGALGGTLLLVFVISGLQDRMSAMTAGAVFFFYAALNGVWMSAIFLIYTSGSIASTFFITAGMFGATSLFGALTKRDLSGLGSFAFMGLIGIILASIVNIFLGSPMISWMISYIGVIVFVGLTAYDTQKLHKIGGMGLDAESEARASVQGALMLYLDFINIFLFLLRIFGNRR